MGAKAPVILTFDMFNLISYTLDAVLDLCVSDYFRYSLGVLVIIGVLALAYRLSGKA